MMRREKAKASLRQSEANFREVFDNTAHGIFIIAVLEDGNFRIVNSNPAGEIVTTIRREDMQGKLLEDALPSEIAQTLRANCNHCIETGTAIAYEEVADLPAGRRYYHIALAPVRDESGRFYRIIGSTLDITAHRRAEEIIRLRLKLFEFAADHSLEELMQRALDEIGEITNSPIGFYHFVEADQKTLSLQAWSTRTLQEFCRAEGRGLHYSIDEAGVWVDCVHQRRPVIHNDYAALSHRKGMPPGHAEVKRELVVPILRHGRIVSILGVGNKPSDYDEKDVELVAYVADVIWSIIERKRDEERLQDYQRQLEAQNLELRKLSLAIEQSGSTIVITDLDGNIQYVNPRFEETTGYTASEALGQNPRVLKSGEQDADYYRVLWETISSGQIWRGEFHNRRKDGTLYWESATIAPVQNSAGQITSYIAIKEDITEARKAQETLRQYAEQLAAQNAELDAFAHTVAHDLKSPISIVIGFAGILAEDYQTMTPEGLADISHRILRAGQKLDEIVEELMLLAGVRKQEVIPEALDMGHIVRESIERLQVLAQDRQARITLPEDAAWPVALGYAPWIEEVWANYISNAIKYGGEPPQITVGATVQPDEHIRFWVQDNGPGLDAEAQQRLFTPFTRLEQVHAKGHGLGLSVARRIIEKLGGQVGVESTLGQGSTFYFALPAAPVQALS
jgi:PAS domain S-box-containing protein